jgi:coenzyme F420-reducing hydrogenase alpha subunit
MGSTLNFGKEIIPEYFTNATLYALKEVRQQFGVDGVMPAIVNIGPGIPENAEKWEKMREMLHWSPSKNDSLVPTTKDVSANKDDPTTTSTTNPKHTSLVSKLLRHSSKEGKHVKRSWSGDIVEKIKTSKANTELQINNELKDFQSGSKYVRLVLDRGPKLTACTDLMASQEAKECTEEYLESDEAKSSMRQYWELIPPGRREAEVLPVN